MSTQLRVMAVSAPELPHGGLGPGVLPSQDPASLFNAARVAAQQAEQGVGVWGESNWTTRQERRNTFLLMHSLEGDLPRFEALLQRIRPNLLLIGAMTLCLPGAVECAKRAKELLGQEVTIVLGGRHAFEVMYHYQGKLIHHAGSPLRLIQEGLIPDVFDLVVAGEGEYIIPFIGEVVSKTETISNLKNQLGGITNIPGNWIVGGIENKKIWTVSGFHPIDRNALPSPVSIFGVRTSFGATFGGLYTGHVYSDTGAGCVEDCKFCSERRSLTGKLQQPHSAADRLARHLADTERMIRVDYGAPGSAFCEDSTLLGGSESQLRRLIKVLMDKKLNIRFGGQFTIDQILRLEKTGIFGELTQVGFTYLYVGIETPDPHAIGGMSKDRGKGLWMDRTERVLKLCSESGITMGCALLFGLGESHASRLQFIKRLQNWQKIYGSPNPISYNWAVQHPQKGQDGGTSYRYHEWGIPPGSPFIEAFRNFGEASVRYPLAGQKPPVLQEVKEINSIIESP